MPRTAAVSGTENTRPKSTSETRKTTEVSATASGASAGLEGAVEEQLLTAHVVVQPLEVPQVGGGDA